MTYKKGLDIEPSNAVLQAGLKQAEDRDPGSSLSDFLSKKKRQFADLLLQRRVLLMTQSLLKTPVRYY